MIGPGIERTTTLATPNYAYEKRQRELEKKRKKEEKLKRKSQPRPDGSDPGADDENTGEPPADGAPASGPSPT